jgi:hypothetical protein
MHSVVDDRAVDTTLARYNRALIFGPGLQRVSCGSGTEAAGMQNLGAGLPAQNVSDSPPLIRDLV